LFEREIFDHDRFKSISDRRRDLMQPRGTEVYHPLTGAVLAFAQLFTSAGVFL
jgi:hypothetical protein